MRASFVRGGGVVFILLLVAFTAIPRAAIAHEHAYEGDFDFTIGWRVEPPFVGVLNGLDLKIEKNITGGGQEPVEGVAAALTATLSIGGSSVVKSLEPQFGQPGWYTFEVIPTREGIYSVRIQGTLETTAVDETVEIHEVGVRGDIEFPVPDPTTPELKAENVALQSQMTLAMGVGVVGILVGLVSLVVAVRAMRKRPVGP